MKRLIIFVISFFCLGVSNAFSINEKVNDDDVLVGNAIISNVHGSFGYIGNIFRNELGNKGYISSFIPGANYSGCFGVYNPGLQKECYSNVVGYGGSILLQSNRYNLLITNGATTNGLSSMILNNKSNGEVKIIQGGINQFFQGFKFCGLGTLGLKFNNIEYVFDLNLGNIHQATCDGGVYTTDIKNTNRNNHTKISLYNYNSEYIYFGRYDGDNTLVDILGTGGNNRYTIANPLLDTDVIGRNTNQNGESLMLSYVDNNGIPSTYLLNGSKYQKYSDRYYYDTYEQSGYGFEKGDDDNLLNMKFVNKYPLIGDGFDLLNNSKISYYVNISNQMYSSDFITEGASPYTDCQTYTLNVSTNTSVLINSEIPLEQNIVTNQGAFLEFRIPGNNYHGSGSYTFQLSNVVNLQGFPDALYENNNVFASFDNTNTSFLTQKYPLMTWDASKGKKVTGIRISSDKELQPIHDFFFIVDCKNIDEYDHENGKKYYYNQSYFFEARENVCIALNPTVLRKYSIAPFFYYETKLPRDYEICTDKNGGYYIDGEPYIPAPSHVDDRPIIDQIIDDLENTYIPPNIIIDGPKDIDLDNPGNINDGKGYEGDIIKEIGKVEDGLGVYDGIVYIDKNLGTCELFNDDGEFIYTVSNVFEFDFNVSSFSSNSFMKTLLGGIDLVLNGLEKPLNSLFGFVGSFGLVEDGKKYCLFGHVYQAESQKYLKFDGDLGFDFSQGRKKEVGKQNIVDYIFLFLYGAVYLMILFNLFFKSKE